MFVVVTAVRWLLDPASPAHIGSLHLALAVIGTLVALVLLWLILSPPGRRSGAHLNPAVSLALWLMRAFPGRAVVPYAVAQLCGALAGTAFTIALWAYLIAPLLGAAVGALAHHYLIPKCAPPQTYCLSGRLGPR
ncbi:aquaporin [Streptomyces sp. NPDC059989]|uniref:aquaporin n=1 Tax=Streptomyces sp. NPDC059989 TaxID=3347026 RepID=UPI0036C622E8